MSKDTTNSQSLLVVRSFDTPLPDDVAGRIGEIFPAFELIESTDEFGKVVTILGNPIPNATYRQRLVCNRHTANPTIEDEAQLQRILNQTPRIYNPDQFDVLGFPIDIDQTLIGQPYFVISILKTRGVDESLRFAREQYTLATGRQLTYPEGDAIIAVEVESYLKQQPETP